MDAIIMAAGKGTRMQPLTETTPKPLLMLQGQPILHWSLQGLRTVADRVLVVVSYLGEQIEAYMQQQGIFSDYAIVRQTPKPLGTGHALQCCQPHLHSDAFMVLNGDDLYNVSALQRLAATSTGLLAVWKDDPTKYAAVIRNDDDSLQRLHEKPPEGMYTPPVLVNIGGYKLDQSIFAHELELSARGEYELTDYVTYLAGQKPMAVIEADFWQPIGYPHDLDAAQKLDLQALVFDHQT
jgi:UDP-N-acetylglucosamine diphosphorylase / glucose-1-phosphate thymidylyltransferase / UDP-N-acetylgalactosamine diphosphorylase / glucosamine-1-phosphate N-acetyltransferase / galactosamine-1-phosphate N-acetyltransferase